MNLMLSLFVSLLVETAVLLLVLKEQKKQLLVACSIFATTLTHSLFSLVLISKFLSIPKLFSFPLIYPLFVLSYEVFVVFAEGAIFKILLERISWKKALLASLAANFASFVLGIALRFLL